ncbi:MAG: M28 family peptidase [Candidatus Tectomicrobia bacterium]|nr:M28 family peptidase [Candidatus Tectomicrobia bacterium]
MRSRLFVGIVLVFAVPLLAACGTQEGSLPAAGARLGFEGERAMRHVERIVSFGPRPVGSEALTQTRAYLRAELRSLGLAVREQPFTARTPLGPKPMVNLLAVLPGERPEAIGFGAHYESKLFLNFRFVGANDSASAVGVLLELARVLARRRPEERPATAWFLFFDGEEALLNWSPTDSLYGSRHFVEELKRGRLAGDGLPPDALQAMINLDMIGDARLDVVRERRSTPWLRDLVWRSAAELGHAAAFSGPSMEVEDDHIPFLAAGIPALDLLDFTYGGASSPGPFWHTPHDTLDKLSAKSLQIIGETVLHSLPKIAAKVAGRELAAPGRSPN